MAEQQQQQQQQLPGDHTSLIANALNTVFRRTSIDCLAHHSQDYKADSIPSLVLRAILT